MKETQRAKFPSPSQFPERPLRELLSFITQKKH